LTVQASDGAHRGDADSTQPKYLNTVRRTRYHICSFHDDDDELYSDLDNWKGMQARDQLYHQKTIRRPSEDQEKVGDAAVHAC